MDAALLEVLHMDIREIKNITDLIKYFASNLGWEIAIDDFEVIQDISYDFSADDIGLKEESFAKISSLRQLQPLVDGQKWGIFCIEFDSKRFEPSALRKILSRLVPRRRNSFNHAVWDQHDLLFICNWGEDNNRTIGVVHFEDNKSGLAQIKMISCAPALEDFTQIKIFEGRLSKLQWPKDTFDIENWRESWASAFANSAYYGQVIKDSSTLTVNLAAEAQNIRNRIIDTLSVETPNGYVHLLYRKFKDTLVHDMTEQQFADMYAQTVVYGLFSARCMDSSKSSFSADDAIDCVPITNPFLKNLMKECVGAQSRSSLSFDELDIGSVVDLLLHANTELIIQDFNRQTGGGKEDPVIHFYEEFLTAYDKAQKVQRGVFYTPQPVVGFMVRAVDDLIRKEFGFQDGLASIESKRIEYLRQSKKRNVDQLYTAVKDYKSVPAIQILDPATGTGTFIRQAILQIYDTFRKKHEKESEDKIRELWNRYVPLNLLPRINAFELMMAPYAVAHMKLAMVLKDTGYKFESNERLKVCLTNSLEEAGSDTPQWTLWDDPLAAESIEANKVKNNTGINIIIGNPPYSGESANKGAWISCLMETYKKEPGGEIKLQERNPKWLNDDYVKFIRYSENRIMDQDDAILAFINPHGFIDNPTFRGMRWHLLRSFSDIYILDLHGNSNRKEKNPAGGVDENVFDIQQGVSINIFVKNSNKKKQELANVYHADIWGSRENKYEVLNKKSIEDIDFERIMILKPEYNFKNTDYVLRNQYNTGFSVNDVFIEHSVGVVTSNDSVLIAETKNELIDKVSSYYHITPDEKKIKKIYYRPLDIEYIYYDPGLIERSREKMMYSFNFPNCGLITARSNKGNDCSQFLVTNTISEAKCGERTTQSAVFPLYLYLPNMDNVSKKSNLNMQIVSEVSKKIRVPFSANNNEIGFSAEELLSYIYGCLYSQNYREKYKEFINNDFPRIPYPKDKEEFYHYVKYGNQLMDLHLCNKTKDSISLNYLIGKTIDVVKHDGESVHINKTDIIGGIDDEVWDFIMCGYQPLQKYLKDRRGTVIDKVIVGKIEEMIYCIRETIKIMKEIDRC